MIVNGQRRPRNRGEREEQEVALGGDGRYIGAAAGESAGRRGTGDIEPNAPNKANVMELMTGCVSLALVTCAFHSSMRVRDTSKEYTVVSVLREHHHVGDDSRGKR